MAHFYGTIKGSRGEASRLGTKGSGVDVTAASWQGACSVYAYEKDGIDYVRVTLRPWHGAGNSVELYDGPISGEGLPRDYNQAALQGLAMRKLASPAEVGHD